MTLRDWLPLCRRPHWCRPADWHDALGVARMLERMGVAGPSLGELRESLGYRPAEMAWQLGVTPLRYSLLEAGWWPLRARDRARAFEAWQVVLRCTCDGRNFQTLPDRDVIMRPYLGALLLAAADGGSKAINDYVWAAGERFGERGRVA